MIPSPASPMAPVDRAWLRMDEPANLMVINGIMMLDREVPAERIREVLSRRLLMVPRFRDRVVPAAGGHAWEVAEVDIAAHVPETTIETGTDDLGLEAHVSMRMSEPLDPSRPLWSCEVIQGHPRGTVMLWRIHHCIGDGIALMMVMLALTDRDPDVDAWEAALAGDREFGNPLVSLFTDRTLTPEDAKDHVAQFMPEAVTLLTRPAEIIQRLPPWQLGIASSGSLAYLFGLPPDRRTPFKGPLAVEKKVAWSKAIPVADVAAMRKSMGGTVNDLITTAVAGGLGRYLVGAGFRSNLDIRAVVPVSLRPLERLAELGNEFGLVFLSLPLGIDDPRARLAELQRRMKKLKSSAQPIVALWFLRQIGKLPQLGQDGILRLFGMKGTAVMTNVPGPRERLSFAGAQIRDILFWVPQSGRLGMGISILSYAGNVRLGLATDAGLIPDPQRIIDGFEAELERMAR